MSVIVNVQKNNSLKISTRIYDICRQNYICIIHVSLDYCDRMQIVTDRKYTFRAADVVIGKEVKKKAK
jgi:hypothetical protein